MLEPISPAHLYHEGAAVLHSAQHLGVGCVIEIAAHLGRVQISADLWWRAGQDISCY